MMKTVSRLLLLLAVGLIGGCQAVAALTYKTVGPPKEPAVYAPLNEPMLVLAENYKSPGSPFVDASQLARFVADELTTRNVVPVIEPSKLYDLQQKDRAGYRKMSAAAIGRAVGAKQVLYIDITRSSIDNIGAEMSRAGLDLNLKIIDAETGAVRWPQETTAGYPITAQTPYQKTGENFNELALRESVARSVSITIVRLFRSYKPDEE